MDKVKEYIEQRMEELRRQVKYFYEKYGEYDDGVYECRHRIYELQKLYDQFFNEDWVPEITKEDLREWQAASCGMDYYSYH